MELVRGIKIISYVTVATVCGVATKRICSALRSPRMVRSTFDAAFSDDIKQLITKKIEQHGSVTADLVKELKQTYPLIATISSNYHVPGILDVRVQAYQPVVCINDDAVMVAGGSVVERGLFAPTEVLSLPKIFTPVHVLRQAQDERGKLSVSFQKLSETLHKQLWTEYKITWYSPFDIELRSKKNKKFSIVCSYDHVPTLLLLRCCEQIHRDKGIRSYREWVADVRFDNQILVRSTQRGKDNGQSIFR